MYLNPVFRRTLEYRFAASGINIESQITAYQRQVKDEVDKRHPDMSVIR